MSTSAARIAPSYSPHIAQSRRPSAKAAHAYAHATEGSLARQLAVPEQTPKSAPDSTRDRLRVVEGDRSALRRSAWPFVLLALLAAALAIVFPMVLNTQMAQRSYDIRDMQIELAELRSEASALESQVLQAGAPDSLEVKAREIGLLPAAGTGIITLESGTVEGGVPAW